MPTCLHTNPDRIYADIRSLMPGLRLTLEHG
ncbi:hypothetical protein EV286_108237 [Rhizobium sp. BK251]|nr:hypothetical protein EV286_108237 [Rhizobium sp. BK251]